MMTYLELSADNILYDHFTSALFLPQTQRSTAFRPCVRCWKMVEGSFEPQARGGSRMSQPTVFDRNPRLTQPAGRLAWQESFGPTAGRVACAVGRTAVQSRDRRSLRRGVG